MGVAATAVVGIDVSKATLDACLLLPGGAGREKAFPNTPAGFAALLAWADRHAGGAEAHFGMEATGGYEDALATALHAAGRAVSVVNPTRIEYAGSAGSREQDGRGRRPPHRRVHPRPGTPALVPAVAGGPGAAGPGPPPGRLAGLGRAGEGGIDGPLLTPAARRSVARVVKFLAKEADAMQAAADALTAAAPALKAARDLLASVPGVGTQTASTVLAELPALDRVPSAQSGAAYCGLSPREFRSGSSVRGRTRLSKSGNARLRKALDLPTLTAVRFNPVLKAFYARLVDAGKPKMQAVGACMRKLVMIRYGVLKNRAPFDPAWASRIAP